MTEALQPIDPSELTPKRGEEAIGLAQLEAIAAPLGELATGVASRMERLRELDLHEVDIEVEGPEEIAGKIHVYFSTEDEVCVRISGKLGSELPAMRGVPYTASWKGKFFRRANPKLPFIIEDNTEVEKDQVIAWAFKNKNTHWGLRSPSAGIVHFAVDHESEVEKDETVIYYIEERK